VEPEEAPTLRDELAARLRELTFEGQAVITRIFPREEAFRGSRTELGPDLVLLSAPGFDLKGTTRGSEVFAPTHFQGMHTRDDAFVWSLLPVPDDPEISDLAAVILEWLSA
jgi:predicted AlkP superfamily phosphohydrolase/phosphomutase